MNIVSFTPFGQIDSLRSQIDQVFAEIEGSDNYSYDSWKPAVELLENDDNLILRMVLSGINRQDLDIEVTRESVSISGERHRPEIDSSRNLYSELKYGKFQRQISLPMPVVNTQAKADYEDGILTLVLPKVEEARHKVIKINLAHSNSVDCLPEVESKEELELASA